MRKIILYILIFIAITCGALLSLDFFMWAPNIEEVWNSNREQVGAQVGEQGKKRAATVNGKRAATENGKRSATDGRKQTGANSRKQATTDGRTQAKADADKISKVHFIDTGNSDAILVENDGEYMLVDGGDTDDDKKVNDYLREVGVKKLRYVVVTHAHADHMGALDTVITNFKVKKVFVGNSTADTKTYKQFEAAVEAEGLEKVKPVEARRYKLGKGTLTFFNVNGIGDSNLNNDSLITKYENREDVFLFMGDAEQEVEKKYEDRIGDVNVLKAGHHGSTNCSSKSFVETIKPDDVVIMTGRNSYGHPNKRPLNLFRQDGIKIHRTDRSGDIMVKSTGNGVRFVN